MKAAFNFKSIKRLSMLILTIVLCSISGYSQSVKELTAVKLYTKESTNDREINRVIRYNNYLYAFDSQTYNLYRVSSDTIQHLYNAPNLGEGELREIFNGSPFYLVKYDEKEKKKIIKRYLQNPSSGRLDLDENWLIDHYKLSENGIKYKLFDFDHLLGFIKDNIVTVMSYPDDDFNLLYYETNMGGRIKSRLNENLEDGYVPTHEWNKELTQENWCQINKDSACINIWNRLYFIDWSSLKYPVIYKEFEMNSKAEVVSYVKFNEVYFGRQAIIASDASTTYIINAENGDLIDTIGFSAKSIFHIPGSLSPDGFADRLYLVDIQQKIMKFYYDGSTTSPNPGWRKEAETKPFVFNGEVIFDKHGNRWFTYSRAEKTIGIFKLQEQNNTGISSPQVPMLKVMPNPNNGSFKLDLTNEVARGTKFTVQVVNSLGKVIYSTVSEKNVLHIELINVISGVYYVKVFNKDLFLTNKILIE